MMLLRSNHAKSEANRPRDRRSHTSRGAESKRSAISYLEGELEHTVYRAQTGEPGAVAEIVRELSSLVWGTSTPPPRSRFEFSDRAAVAQGALIKAIDTFDFGANIKFRAFAESAVQRALAAASDKLRSSCPERPIEEIDVESAFHDHQAAACSGEGGVDCESGPSHYVAGDTERRVRRAQAGDQDAVNDILLQFRPLVWASARRPGPLWFAFADRAATAQLALIQAIQTFNIEAGTHFAAYAKQALRYALVAAGRKYANRGVHYAPRKGIVLKFEKIDLEPEDEGETRDFLEAEIAERTDGGTSGCLKPAGTMNGIPLSSFMLIQLANLDDDIEAARMKALGRREYAKSVVAKHLIACNTLSPANENDVAEESAA